MSRKFQWAEPQKLATFIIFPSQTLHMKKILIFKVAQMQKWMAPLERAGKTDQKNAMVRYDSIKSSRDI